MLQAFVLSNPRFRLALNSVLIILCALFCTGCGAKKTIVNALDEKEANEILVYLASKGIEANKIQNAEGAGGGGSKIVMWDIQVSEENATLAMSLLNQVGLPRRRGQSLLNIFAGGGLVPSELQEKIRYQAGLAEQIASTIRKIDGVLDAEVQVSFPEEDPLNPGKKKGPITASVYVKHSGVLDDPNSLLIPKIKRLVAASVTGLDYDNVTVIGDRARYAGNEGLLAIPVEEEKLFVSIWSIVVAKDSVTRFRTIFFSFIGLLLLLVVALIWLALKTFPLLKKHGGIKGLFQLHAIKLEPNGGEMKKQPAESAAKESAQKAKEEENKEIDET